MNLKDAIVLHHSGVSSTDPQFDAVYAYHNAGAGGKWSPGRGIQYHYFIEKSGAIRTGRAEDSVGYHAGNWLMNLRSIGICLAGDFRREQPTNMQRESLARLLTDLQIRHLIPDTRIFLHREVRKGDPTQCPGIDLRAVLFAEREELLLTRINRVKGALERAEGARRGRLERLLRRLLALVP